MNEGNFHFCKSFFAFFGNKFDWHFSICLEDFKKYEELKNE